jgi:hypothetical protein
VEQRGGRPQMTDDYDSDAQVDRKMARQPRIGVKTAGRTTYADDRKVMDGARDLCSERRFPPISRGSGDQWPERFGIRPKVCEQQSRRDVHYQDRDVPALRTGE